MHIQVSTANFRISIKIGFHFNIITDIISVQMVHLHYIVTKEHLAHILMNKSVKKSNIWYYEITDLFAQQSRRMSVKVLKTLSVWDPSVGPDPLVYTLDFAHLLPQCIVGNFLLKLFLVYIFPCPIRYCNQARNKPGVKDTKAQQNKPYCNEDVVISKR